MSYLFFSHARQQAFKARSSECIDSIRGECRPSATFLKMYVALCYRPFLQRHSAGDAVDERRDAALPPCRVPGFGTKSRHRMYRDRTKRCDEFQCIPDALVRGLCIRHCFRAIGINV